MYNVSYFCTVGNPRKQNQDRVLVNGDLLQDGIRHRDNLKDLHGFVADGVGSLFNSGNAAQFVLSRLQDYHPDPDGNPQAAVRKTLIGINNELVKLNNIAGDLQDSATTLCGIILQDKQIMPVNVGDSEILIVRNNELFCITQHQVLDSEMPNSPITSYLGGRSEHMDIDFSNSNYLPEQGDIIIVTTDGLQKAIERNKLIEMLSSPTPFSERVDKLFMELCSHEVPDNLGAIFIQCVG